MSLKHIYFCDELQDDLAKVREDFESARSNLEKEQAERKLLLSKFSSDGQVREFLINPQRTCARGSSCLFVYLSACLSVMLWFWRLLTINCWVRYELAQNDDLRPFHCATFFNFSIFLENAKLSVPHMYYLLWVMPLSSCLNHLSKHISYFSGRFALCWEVNRVAGIEFRVENIYEWVSLDSLAYEDNLYM